MRSVHPPAILLIILLMGCEKDNAPLMSHGKPVSHWLEELKKPDSKARRKAVLALGHVGTADSAAIPALIGAVKDRDATVRSKAILALLNIGPDAKDALPVLNDASKDTDPMVRSYAAKAVQRIQGGRSPCHQQ
jgi:HEAT repeat protein